VVLLAGLADENADLLWPGRKRGARGLLEILDRLRGSYQLPDQLDELLARRAARLAAAYGTD